MGEKEKPLTRPVTPLQDPYSTRKVVNKGDIPKSVIGNQPPQVPQIVRSVAFMADYAGCGHYRMLWPNWVINSTYTSPKKIDNQFERERKNLELVIR